VLQTGQPNGSSRFRAIGPALIVASVVLGPGSILTSSRIGARFGYELVWLLVAASALMAGTVALAARIGVSFAGTPCDEIRRRVGRPLAVLLGLTMFATIAAFQVSNDLAVLAALETLLGRGMTRTTETVVLVAVNGLVVAALYGLRRLYIPIERLMMLFVLLMIAAFVGNLPFARPSLTATLGGLWPSLPPELRGSLLPARVDGRLIDPLLPVQALVATTFSAAGAFYQAYLVREKDWTIADLRAGLRDSILGIAVLGGLTLVIMLTAAAVLHGKVDPESLAGAQDVARQLEPLCGSFASALFAVGLFAGAFSSFLVNAMIGGALLSDGLGRGASMDAPWPKAGTVLALAVGAVVALGTRATGTSTVQLIVFAQALTVLGVPLLLLTLLYLATRPELVGPRRVPRALHIVGALACVVAVALSLRTALRLWLAA
jgi:Mn2+/Fe2+ NRAMP family transporter